MTPTRSSVDLRPPESREKILETAERLFAVGGYAGVGMRELATTVGLSKSALFHHFPNKQDLYSAVLDRSLVRIEAALLAASRVGSPVEQLEAWIDAVVRTLSEDAPAGRLMMRALVDEAPFPAIVLHADAGLDRDLEDFELRLAGILERFGALLEEGIASGAFRPVSIPDTLLSVIGAITFHFSSGELGEALLGESVFSGPAVERRRREVSQFIRRGLVA